MTDQRERCLERLLSHLRPSQMAIVYVLIESTKDPSVDVPDDEVSGAELEKESILRRIESYVHSEGRYDFGAVLLPAARTAIKRIGFG